MGRPDLRGVALCLAAAAGFGSMAIFAKAAYSGGANVPTLLAVRFTLAAVILWALVLRAAPPRPSGKRRRRVTLPLPALALGVLYAIEATAFFLALTRIDAAFAELLLYVYPAIVVLGAAALGRERLTAARVQALALSSAGLVLVLAAGGLSTVDLLGLFAALASACLYAGYVLLSDHVVGDGDPLVVSAQIVTAAAVCFVVYGVTTGTLDLRLSAEGWFAILAVTLLSTVVAIVAFLQGMQRVGPSTATLISMVEPVVTVGLAMAVLGERLAPAQLLGGLLVLGALSRLARVDRADEPAVVPSPAAPVGQDREGVAVG